MKEIALVDRDIKKLVSSGCITHINDINLIRYIQPASLDIPTGNKAYLVRFKFLPFIKDISHVVEKTALEEIDLDKNPILYKGQTYLIPCIKFNDFPKEYLCKMSPKSSIGRIDMMVRSISDSSPYYDYIENPSKTLWLEVTPRSFNVRVKTGIALCQMKILERRIGVILDLEKENIIFDRDGEALSPTVLKDDEIVLRISIPQNDLVGYIAKSTNEVIDLSKIGEHDGELFFDEIKSFGNNYSKILLEKDKFYILRTKDFIQIPPRFSAEMIPLNNLLGEFRVHYAGFFDPGFGFGNNGNEGVLEIRPHENLLVYDSQPICSMKFYKNKNIPEKEYGNAGNNYSKQKGAKLAKYFKIRD